LKETIWRLFDMISNLEKVTSFVLIVALALTVFNSVQIGQLKGSVATGMVSADGAQLSTVDVIPKGIPKIYGQELGVSYDDVSAVSPQRADAAIAKLGNLDNSITLEGDDLQRYISIVSGISCEYCCGAPSIIFSNGEAACGCAHSYAMRGLAKYLITKHGSEFTDDEILEELGKWKALFFPTQMTAKAKALADNEIEFNYINLASNKYRGIEQGVSGGMVGGC
jgi:hypothetical protein